MIAPQGGKSDRNVEDSNFALAELNQQTNDKRCRVRRILRYRAIKLSHTKLTVKKKVSDSTDYCKRFLQSLTS